MLVQYSSPIVVPPAAQLIHGQSFSISGSGFGTKSRALAPLVRDVGAAAVGTLDSQWTGGYTNNGAQAVYNIQNQVAATFNPNSNASPVGAPHRYITNLQAFSNAGNDANSGWRGGPFYNYTIPTLPYALFYSVYFRCDPSWTFGTPPNNYKHAGITNSGDVLTGTMDWFFNFAAGDGPGDNTVVNFQIAFTDNATALTGPPDAAGHSWFWNNILSPFNPSNGWLKMEMEAVITSTLGTGAGYCNVWCNALQAANYQGRTCNTVDTAHALCPGMHIFTGNNGHATNFNYAADFYVDASSTLGAATGNVARVYLTNNPIPFQGNFGQASPISFNREPQIATAWSDSKITFTVWKGLLLSGNAYIGVQTESGSTFTFGPYILQ